MSSESMFSVYGRFPRNYRIPVSKLTKLWIAEGFLKPNGPKSLEELAEGCLEDIVKKNLVLIIEKRSNGKIRFCGLHDLLRDLCIQKARMEEFLHVTNNSARGIQHQRRLSIHFDISDGFVAKCASASPIHSILYFHWSLASLSFLRGYRLLRVLDLLRTVLPFMPPEITQLFHLRFLALSGRLKVPPSISKLQNLQTLMIRVYRWETGDSILFLPIEMWEMRQLRHLIVYGGSMLPTPLAAAPSGRRVLENLQTLSVDNFKFTSQAIEMIPNLKKLKICYDCPFRAAWIEYCLSNLVHLCQLETLNLMFRPIGLEVNPFPAIFTLPSTLQKLTLTDCALPWQDMAIIRSLPNLEVLKLRDDAFIGDEWNAVKGSSQG
ncbi:UNVERIFIED_CONTAM: putative late blight resistance proteinR1A-10 [Sesamum radiatum]|uniref:Late blight resistance proteinR1A-10 n=1 Tax=Sesamum radiatum TaxID=300843 RepID=A0AAW2VNC2_SESRA